MFENFEKWKVRKLIISQSLAITEIAKFGNEKMCKQLQFEIKKNDV